MKNLFILGSGRCGTSLLAGMLQRAGYYFGDNLIAPQPSNPRGFFESFDINQLNEELLAPVPRRDVRRKWFASPRKKPLLRQFWLCRVPVGTPIMANASAAARIRALTQRAPFCFKDPRFSYTLPAWRPHAPGARFICVFRSPASTAQSIVENCRTSPYYSDIAMNHRRALAVWTCMYLHILRTHRHEGEWLFVHYEQAFSMDGLERLASFTDARPDPAFADPALLRPCEDKRVPRAVREIYGELCALAGYPVL